jgi:chemotaxis protein histidine kinase CheA
VLADPPPLTLAIMAALIVEADDRPFAIPLDRIERTVRLKDQPSARSPAGACWSVRRRPADRRRL